VSVQTSDEFNALSVEQVHATARAADDLQLAAMLIVAAFAGLIVGIILALLWDAFRSRPKATSA
jgi:hypothetical protein